MGQSFSKAQLVSCLLQGPDHPRSLTDSLAISIIQALKTGGKFFVAETPIQLFRFSPQIASEFGKYAGKCSSSFLEKGLN